MKSKSSTDKVIQVNDISIGDNLKAQRLKAGYRQIDFVAALQLNGIDISVFTYNRIEKGSQNPSVSFLLAACHLLNCDMNDLFGFSK